MAGESATAFAPASIGNVGVGFDVLGLAIAGPGDRVVAERIGEPGVTIGAMRATELARGAETLPLDPTANTASIAVAAWADAVAPGFGVRLQIEKGIPLASGMGSSAASAVAAVVAANALLDEPLPMASLLPFALEGERFASKASHADNVAPSLLGGLVLCPARLLPDTIRLPVPDGIVSVLVHPELAVETAASRRSLAAQCLLATAVEQQGCLAAFVAACFRNDGDLVRRSLADLLIEPQRGPLVEGFAAAKRAALDAGALGASLSGSGPSMFALAVETEAVAVRDAVLAAYADADLAADAWISPLATSGARLVD